MAIRKRSWISGKGEQTAWVVDYKDQKGKRRLKTFAKQKHAKAWWEGQAAYEVKQGTHTPASASITVAQAAENWIKRAELEGRERSTIVQKRQHVELHINPLIGNLKLSELTAPGMEGVKDKLLDKLSRPTAKKVMTSIKGILSEAQRRGHVAQNVAQNVSIKMDGRHKRKLRAGVDIPSREEIQKILHALEGRWRPVLVTAIFTGLRASELRGLIWENVDFEARVIHVRQRADKWGAIGSPKSEAGDRAVPMSPMVLNVLREWKLECPKSELGLVFPTGPGKVEYHSNIYQRGFAPVQVKAGVVTEGGKPKYGIHALRHFYASWLINRKRDGGLELPAKKVQERLGHSTITMTLDIYGHLFPEGEDEFDELAEAETALIG
jgi:integrase